MMASVSRSTLLLLPSLWLGIPGAWAETPLSFCLSRAAVGVTVGEKIAVLGDTRPSDHTLTLRNALITNLRGYGATPVNILARPSPLGSLEGLAAPLDEADRHRAAMLVVLEMDAKEYRLSNPYIGGDQFPLRTVQLLLHIWVVAGKSGDIWSDFTLDRTFAANSVDEAVSRFASEELADPLAKALRDGCDELQQRPQPNAPAPPSHQPELEPPPYSPPPIQQAGLGSTHQPPMASAPPPSPVMTRRTALVIGDTDYKTRAIFRRLPNASRDAEKMAKTFKIAGFNLVSVPNYSAEDRGGFQEQMKKFIEESKDSDIAALYFAGHGAADDDGNYYIYFSNAQNPADTSARVSLNELTDAMIQTGAKLKLLILDACRNSPNLPKVPMRGIAIPPLDNKVGSVTPDEAKMRGIASKMTGIVIMFATDPGAEATDGKPGENGPFASALSDQMLKPGKRIFDILNDTANEVLEITHGQQDPWFNSSHIPENFVLFSG